eukprot:2217522-Rhodomonas_salina.1
MTLLAGSSPRLPSVREGGQAVLVRMAHVHRVQLPGSSFLPALTRVGSSVGSDLGGFRGTAGAVPYPLGQGAARGG